jgi:hypothetical protein
MSQENVEAAQRGYALLNAAYKCGDVNNLLPFAREAWDPDIVLTTSGRMLPEAGEWRGHEGLLRFTRTQMEAFSEMRVEPQEYVEAGDRLVVPVRFGAVVGIPEQIRQLAELRDSGALTDDEFEAKKTELLRRM